MSSPVLVFHIMQTAVIKINSRSMSFELCLRKESSLASEVASCKDLIATLINCSSC